MRFVDFQYKKFTFPLKSSTQNSKQILKSKVVIIIKALDRYDHFHYGEVSPLEGFSKESVEDCKLKLDELSNHHQFENEINLSQKKIGELHEYPSLLFGLEQLILSAELHENKNQVEIEKKKNIIKINALIGIEESSIIIKKIRELHAAGYDTIKLKIGKADFKEDLAVIKLINEEFGDELKLRLDNNGSWSFDEAVKNIALLSKFNIEYIEQPVKGKAELFQLTELCDLNLAPDECITSYEDAENFILSGKINFLILKPSIRLGIYDSIKLIELSNKVGVNIIISSAFETIIGRLTLLYIASLTNHNLSHGLSTQLLGSDSYPTIFNYNVPLLEISNLDYHPYLKMDL